MDCTQWHDVISARLDGEATDPEQAALFAHLSGCVACRAYERRLEVVARAARLRPAEAVPDLSAAIMAQVVSPGRRTVTESARWMLAWVGIAGLLLAIPALVLGDDRGATAHVARHIGSFDVALSVGFLIAAFRPARALALLPVTGALGLCTLISAALGLHDGTTTLALESHHLVELVGLTLVWMVAGMPRPRATIHQLRAA
jgi:predicted anti-sigma-YlaC factor YlaD